MPANLLLRLPRAALARRDAITRLAENEIERSLFAFKCDELAFARALLERHPNWWLYRTSQRAFAGDFVAVDLSPRRDRRSVFALELKRGQRVRPITLPNADAGAVVRALAERGVIDVDAPVESLVGDAGAILEAITPRRRTRSTRASGP